MSENLPSISTREMKFDNGSAIGMSSQWTGSQYCKILTSAGIVGCGIFDMTIGEAFSQAIAVARGTPENPLVEPEDLLDAEIVDLTSKAESFGVCRGMTGREAVETMLAASAD